MSGVVARHSRRMSEIGQVELPDIREWSKGYLECLEVVGRPSRMFVSGQEALPNVQEWLGGYPG